jgi:hypothetical protein
MRVPIADLEQVSEEAVVLRPRPGEPHVSDDDRALINERVNADLQLQVVRGTPHYEFRARGPVEYVPIRRKRDGVEQLLGYLWFSDAESAAGYVADQALSPESDNLGMVWIEHLARANAEGAAPSAAVQSFDTLPDGPGGHVMLAEQATAPSLRDLRAAAGFAV